MRAVVQRVKEAHVDVDEHTVGRIGQGLLVLLGIGQDDGEEEIRYIADKSIHLRIFEDEDGKMNLSLKDVKGSLLVVSQFTLYGDARKGRRPSFTSSASPDRANALYEKFLAYCKEQGVHTEAGIFQADMKVHLVNDGPVTILLDSEKNF